MNTTVGTDSPGELSPVTHRPLRFCMVTTFYPPYNFGGDGIFVQRLARALIARGHQVTVVHCADAYRMVGGEAPADAVPADDGVTVHTLSSRAGSLSPLVTHQLGVPGFKAPALKRVLEEGDFDVIHFHNVSLVGGPGVLAYGDGIKLYTAHEYWLVCPLSTLWKFRTGNCEEKQCVRCTLDAGRPPQWWRYTGQPARALAHVDALIAPSRFAIDQHRAMGLDADFVELPNFLPRAEPLAAGEPVHPRPFFLVAGRMEKTKGVQDAIKTFRDFAGADLLIAGSGPFEDSLRAAAAGADNIYFTGRVSYQQLCQLYRQAVATLVPSIWYEPFGLIVIESFAQCTPVIVHRAGAPPALVEQSGGGLVYDDANGLAQAMQQLLDDPALRDDLGARGRQAYLERWTETQHLDTYLGLIEQIEAQGRDQA